jgi:hypothetical protein
MSLWGTVVLGGMAIAIVLAMISRLLGVPPLDEERDRRPRR